MRLFRNHNKSPDATELQTIQDVRDRVREIRQRLGHRELVLADLFALVIEDEGAILRKMGSKVPDASNRARPAPLQSHGKNPTAKPRSAPALEEEHAVARREEHPVARKNGAGRPEIERLWPDQVPGRREGRETTREEDAARVVRETAAGRPEVERIWPSQVPGCSLAREATPEGAEAQMVRDYASRRPEIERIWPSQVAGEKTLALAKGEPSEGELYLAAPGQTERARHSA